MKKILVIILVSLFYCHTAFSEKLPNDVVSGSKFKKSLTGNYYKKYGMQIVDKKDGHPVRAGKKSIRFRPHLNITKGDIDIGIEAIKHCLKNIQIA